ncbi:polysaccharide pyruvyl transferase family protein [Rhodococcus sp. WS3]|uniref:polysaccharide pyruvyl transferase family protein n=1 Tax=Rhodococcus sp. WS3 TaxID=2486271 RepID=UPI00114349AD|nr:polysaccharide pyruvyl transferase family protein [Rhodococcus sp. WS3]ROZ49699.1 polysaccharide pyruvyl transferase family protein [Rhodococcus sp. WS3]
MKVVITNAVLSNTGDAAICQGIREALIAEGVSSSSQITVMDANSEVTSLLYPEWNVHQQLCYPVPMKNRYVRKIRQQLKILSVLFLLSNSTLTRKFIDRIKKIDSSFGRSLAIYADADLVVSSGGTYLVDHYDFRPRELELRFAAKLGSDVVLWTQSMGPFLTNRSARSASRIASVASAVFFRDQRSADSWGKLTEKRLPGGVCADAAFALKPHPKPRNSELKTVIISVREWNLTSTGRPLGSSQYGTACRSAVTAVENHGGTVRALSTCQGVQGYGIDDSITATKLFQDLGIAIDSQHHTPDDLLDELNQSAGVITTRMHLAILALIARVPVIAIAYEFKTVELFARLGLDDYVCRIEDVSSEWVTGRVTELMTNPETMMLSPETVSELREECLHAAIVAGSL